MDLAANALSLLLTLGLLLSIPVGLAPSVTVADGAVCLEGSAQGTAIALRSSYPAELNGAYTRSGYKDRIVAQLSVTIGLLGAAPRFSFTAKPGARDVADAADLAHVGENELARAWDRRALPRRRLREGRGEPLQRGRGVRLSFAVTDRRYVRLAVCWTSTAQMSVINVVAT